VLFELRYQLLPNCIHHGRRTSKASESYGEAFRRQPLEGGERPQEANDDGFEWKGSSYALLFGQL
jgi:hypothetical protein